MNRKNLAILAGGDSSEYVISVKSAGQIMQWIDQERFRPWLVIVKGGDWNVRNENEENLHVDLNDFSVMDGENKIRFEYAFIIIHGTPGEDGKIQSYLEMQGIPYNTCGVLCSALTFNKFACKTYLKDFGVLTAEAVLVRKGQEYDIDVLTTKIGLPCFVKPNNGGSSFGTSKVSRTEELSTAIELALKEDDEVIIESFVKGTEISCGLVKFSDEEVIFPITEIIPKKEFFDYEAKYTEGMSEEITPARIPADLMKKCRILASGIYDFLNCRGIVRIDFIIRGNQLYFLELNSVPGMSAQSIIPQQIRAMGMKVEDILNRLIAETMN